MVKSHFLETEATIRDPIINVTGLSDSFASAFWHTITQQ